MPVEIIQKTGRIEMRSPAEDSSTEHGTQSGQPIPPPDRQSTRRRRLLIGVLGALILAAVCVLGIPWIRLTLNTVSTDDAHVNGHATFVAARVSGQISRV